MSSYNLETSIRDVLDFHGGGYLATHLIYEAQQDAKKLGLEVGAHEVADAINRMEAAGHVALTPFMLGGQFVRLL